MAKPDEDEYDEEVFNYPIPDGATLETQIQIQGLNSILGGVKWSETATNEPSGTDPLTDGLTFSFPIDNSSYAKGYGEAGGQKFLGLTDDVQVNGLTEVKSIRPIFEELNQFMSVEITEIKAPSEGELDFRGDADIRIAKTSMISDADDAWAYYPDGGNGTGKRGGDVWINPTLGPEDFGGDPDFSNDGTLLPGGYNYAVYMHEIGHALGLGHPDGDNPDGVTAPDGKDFLAYTIMANNAFDSIETGAIDGWTYSAEDTPSTFMQYDIAALQYMYGADYTSDAANPGNTNYVWGTDGSLNGVDLNDDSNNIYMTIWDGGGEDTYDFSLWLDVVDVGTFYEAPDIIFNMNPGEWIEIEDTTGLTVDDYTNSQRANLWSRDERPQTEPDTGEIIKWAPGNIANALVFDFNTEDGHADAGWIENAIGGDGDDTFIGNAVLNTFTGGGGADTFVLADDDYLDLITDYGVGANVIDLSDLLEGFGVTAGNVDKFVNLDFQGGPNPTTDILIDSDGGTAGGGEYSVATLTGHFQSALVLFDDNPQQIAVEVV